MDYKKIIVLYLNNTKIEKEAELFRRKFWGDNIPVDIEYIIDIKLKINVIPIPGFLRFANIDALMSSDWKSIYVDRDEYLDERRHNRLRFSLAHEVAHSVLHKKIYTNFNIKNHKDYYKLNKDIPRKQYSYFETQANKFANYLLVPKKVLADKKNQALKEFNKLISSKKIDDKTLNSYLAIPISKNFDVSEEVIEIALSEIENKT